MAIAGHMSRGLREGGLIILGAIAVYLLLSLATYAPSDPGWSRSGTGAGVANIGGVAGAWFADVVLCLVGYLAYLVPPLTGATSLPGPSRPWLRDGTGRRTREATGRAQARGQAYRDERAGQRA